MNNNDTLRRLRFAFDLNDHAMMVLFDKGGYEATRAEVSDWLKREEDETFQPLRDVWRLSSMASSWTNAAKKTAKNP